MAEVAKVELISLHVRNVLLDDPSRLLSLRWRAGDKNWNTFVSGPDVYKIIVERIE